jgi:hypothetical protein
MTNSLRLNSYLKSILEQSNCMSNIILERTMSFKEKQQGSDDNASRQIQQTSLDKILMGPFQPFIKRCFHAISTVSHLRQQLAEQNETIFKNLPTDADDKNNISMQKLKKLSANDSERINESLVKTIKEHHENYDKQIDLWMDRLIESLNKHELELSENETTEFKKLYPIDELLEVLNDLKIPHPGLKKAKHYDFKHYMTLKCRYAIYSCLNKKQEPADENTIKTYLKKIKKELDKIHKDEVELLKNIHNDYNDALKNISFAKVHKQ